MINSCENILLSYISEHFQLQHTTLLIGEETTNAWYHALKMFTVFLVQLNQQINTGLLIFLKHSIELHKTLVFMHIYKAKFKIVT